MANEYLKKDISKYNVLDKVSLYIRSVKSAKLIQSVDDADSLIQFVIMLRLLKKFKMHADFDDDSKEKDSK